MPPKSAPPPEPKAPSEEEVRLTVCARPFKSHVNALLVQLERFKENCEVLEHSFREIDSRVWNQEPPSPRSAGARAHTRVPARAHTHQHTIHARTDRARTHAHARTIDCKFAPSLQRGDSCFAEPFLRGLTSTALTDVHGSGSASSRVCPWNRHTRSTGSLLLSA
jgi:hypothetical protein